MSWNYPVSLESFACQGIGNRGVARDHGTRVEDDSNDEALYLQPAAFFTVLEAEPNQSLIRRAGNFRNAVPGAHDQPGLVTRRSRSWRGFGAGPRYSHAALPSGTRGVEGGRRPGGVGATPDSAELGSRDPPCSQSCRPPPS